ncbi:MAG: zinc metallopeptidase [Candidatus Eisenbacteria bacterium]|nr:zinc metallopeptidase [Candidatus Eisenbacteria bacterium]
MFFDPLYLLIVGPALLLSIWAQIKVKSTFARYSRVATHSNINGAEAAARILQSFGIGNVDVQQTQGFLSDHYDPRKRVLRLSPDVFQGKSIASLGVAAHEAGHALQHAQNYFPLQVRSALVPVTQFGSWLAWPLLLIGFLLQSQQLLLAGIILFSAAVLFQLVTLPVEFDASRRAVAILGSQGILSGPELDGTRKVLSAAALTYIAAAAAAVLQLLYFLMRAGFLGSRDE